MSAELPQLEQLIADAAERHYGGRRLRLPAPRLSLVAGLVAAAAAVVLVIAIFPLGSDERAATPTPENPASALAERYGIFAHGQDVGARAYDIAEDQLQALDPKQPVAVRMLRSFPNGGIVAVAGTGPDGEAAVCLSQADAHSGGGGCVDVADLPADNSPWFVFGVPGVTDSTVNAFVPDDVESVRMELKSSVTRNVPIDNNFAYAKAGETVCAVSWTTEDGRTGRARSTLQADRPKYC